MFKLTREDVRNLGIFSNTCLEIKQDGEYKELYFNEWDEQGNMVGWSDYSRTKLKNMIAKGTAKIIIKW